MSDVPRLAVHRDSAQPSHTDEATFAEAFGNADWAVMMILAREDQTYARLRFGIGPSAEITVPLCIDYSATFAASDHADWDAEFERCVLAEAFALGATAAGGELVPHVIEDLSGPKPGTSPRSSSVPQRCRKPLDLRASFDTRSGLPAGLWELRESCSSTCVSAVACT